MTLSQLITILKARRRIILITAGIALASSAAVSFILPKKYAASAVVVVDNKPTDPINGYAPNAAGQGYMLTQIDILKSDRVAKKVVELLKLTESAALKDQWMSATSGKGSFTGWIANWLQMHMEIKPARESNVMEITYVSPDPQFSAAIANAFAHAYIATAVELRIAPAKQYSAYFDDQLKKAKEQLDTARGKLSAYLREKSLLSSDERFDVESARLNELSQQVVAMRSLSADSNSRQHQTQSSQGDKLQDVLNNPLINGIKTELVRQESQLKDLQSKFGDNYPTVQQQQAVVADLKIKLDTETRRILGSVGVANQVNRGREAEVIAAYQTERAKVLAMKQTRDEAAGLNQDVESSQKAYESILMRLNQVSLESQTTQANVSLLSAADEPAEASQPKIFLNIGVGTVLGLLAGMFLAIRLEQKDRRVRSEEDAVGMFEVPILADMGRANFKAAHHDFSAANLRLAGPSGKAGSSKLLPPFLKNK